MRRRIAAAVAAVGLLGPALGAAADREPPSVTVMGSATVAAPPDTAEVSAGVVTQAPTPAAALARNSAAMELVLRAVAAAGVADRDVQTTGLQVVPQRAQPEPGRREPPDIVGYEVVNVVRIRVRDLGRLGGLLDAVVGQGANAMRGIEFSVADPAPLLRQARARAIADAREKADTYAAAAGVKLGRVLWIRDATQGPPRPMPRVMAAQAVPIAPGEQEVEVSVSVTYAIE
jgi:uncharacterized protein YggE